MLRLKLVLLFVGAPLALAARTVAQPLLFYLGLVVLVVALALPSERGQSLRRRIANLARHLPGGRFLGRSD